MALSFRFLLFNALVLLTLVSSFQPVSRPSFSTSTSTTPTTSSLHVLYSTKEEKQKQQDLASEPPTATAAAPEETTEKFGLEAGLFQSLKRQDGGESAKSLLKKYGIAYLATSIPLALVSFTISYLLVDNGVDVSGLLSKYVGIESPSGAADKAGTFAIAYAAHKAASPIRFPPTVLLTPIVAKMIGKEPEQVDVEEEDEKK
jgi:hypothetical protein